MKPHIDNDLKNFIRQKNEIKKLTDRHPYTYGERYRAIRNRVWSLTDRGEKEFFFFKIRLDACGNNTKKSSKLINKTHGRSVKTLDCTEITFNEVVLTTEKRLADAFSEFFPKIVRH